MLDLKRVFGVKIYAQLRVNHDRVSSPTIKIYSYYIFQIIIFSKFHFVFQ